MQPVAITAEDGVELVLWTTDVEGAAEAVLFVHGATYGALATFGVTPEPAGEPSWFTAVVQQGRQPFGLDVRGYGDSEPVQTDESAGVTDVHAGNAGKDVVAAYRHCRERFERVHLVGFSWGTLVAGHVVTARDVDVASLALVSAVYRPPYGFEGAPSADDDGLPDRAWRRVTKEDARDRWDGQVPTAPPRELRFGDDAGDPVFEAFWDQLVTTSQGIDAAGDAIVAPTGFLRDVKQSCEGTPVYDAADVAVPTLLVRGSFDTTSTREDVLGLYDDLVAVDTASYVELTPATHMLQYEQPRDQLIRTVDAFQAHATA